MRDLQGAFNRVMMNRTEKWEQSLFAEIENICLQQGPEKTSSRQAERERERM